MWDDISAESFGHVRKTIAMQHATIGGMLCCLSVKMLGWENTFAGRSIDQQQRKRVQFVQREMLPGIEMVEAIDSSTGVKGGLNGSICQPLCGLAPFDDERNGNCRSPANLEHLITSFNSGLDIALSARVYPGNERLAIRPLAPIEVFAGTGRVAQWESTSLTSRGSLVQSQPRPPSFALWASDGEVTPTPIVTY